MFTACSIQNAAQPGATGSRGAPSVDVDVESQATATAASAVAAAPQSAAAAPAGAQPAVAGQNPAVAVYQQNGGSVVNITSIAVVSNVFGGQSRQQPQGIGSGFFIDSDGR